MFGIDHLDECVWGFILRPAVALQSNPPTPLDSNCSSWQVVCVHEDVKILPLFLTESVNCAALLCLYVT